MHLYKLCSIITITIQGLQPGIFYKIYLVQPEGVSMDHIVQSFQELPVIYGNGGMLSVVMLVYINNCSSCRIPLVIICQGVAAVCHC